MIVLDVESEQTLAALERVVTALEGLGDVTTVLRVSEGHALLHCIAITITITLQCIVMYEPSFSCRMSSTIKPPDL